MRPGAVFWWCALLAVSGCGIEPAEAGAELSEPELASAENAVTCSRWGISLPDGRAECNACGVSPPCSATQYGRTQSGCVYPDRWCTKAYIRGGTISHTSPTAAYYFNPSTTWRWTSWSCTHYALC